MHHYPFHVADYISSTAHLTPIEDIAYRRLIDHYYTTEQPIPLDTQWVSRRIRLECEVVDRMLSEFFVRRDDGWHQDRCDDEIAKYKARRDRNKINGLGGGRPQKTQSVSSGIEVGSQPRTKNQEPKDGAAAQAPAGFERFWAAWPPHHRKTAKPQCLAKWSKLGLESIADKIVAHVVSMRSHESWTKDGGAYIPAPHRYLNEQRFLSQPAAGADDAPWDSSRRGIEAEGERLGLGVWDEDAHQQGRGESFSAYVSRVRAARQQGERDGQG